MAQLKSFKCSGFDGVPGASEAPAGAPAPQESQQAHFELAEEEGEEEEEGSSQPEKQEEPNQASQVKAAAGLRQSRFAPGDEPSANHFEVRWQRLGLCARKQSSWPEALRQSPAVRLLSGLARGRGRTGEEPRGEAAAAAKPERIYYSPPIGHRWPAGHKPEMALGFDSSVAGAPGAPGERIILNDISGSVFSGQLTAILGPSGVGKTSLLNSLTGRNQLDGSGRVSLIGGASKRMSVVTVPQKDVLPGKLTTLEDLRFTSRLKNPGAHFDHKLNVQRLVRHLHMEKFLHTRIDKLSGGEARRLSIARELLSSPDMMILDEPTSGLDANTCKKIISALRDIVEHSDRIMERPMSIIVTIHQPQQEVLNLFHRCYVMALGGCAIYEGPPGNLLAHLLEHSSLADVCPVEQLNENPAIVALEAASGEYGAQVIAELAWAHESRCTEEEAQGGSGQGSPWLSPRQLRQVPRSPVSVSPKIHQPSWEPARRSHRLSSKESLSIGEPTPTLGRRLGPAVHLDRVSSMTSISYASTYDAELPEPRAPKLKVDKRLRRSVVMKGDLVSQTITLIQRSWLLTTRNVFLMTIRVLGFLLIAVGIIQLFPSSLDPEENICPHYESQVNDVQQFMLDIRQRLLWVPSMVRQSNNMHLFLFQLILCITMVTSALAGLAFPLEMRMFLREYKNGWYSPAAFITSQTLADLPIDMIGPTITVLVVYPLCNQPPSLYHWRLLGYILVLSLSALICKSQAQMVGALLMNSVENSVFISCVMVSPPALLSGLAVRVSHMTWPLQLLSYGSFVRYTFESLLLMRYGYDICPCDRDQVNGFPVQLTGRAMPAHVNRMVQGLLELSLPLPDTNSSQSGQQTAIEPTKLGPLEPVTSLELEADQPGLFTSFLRLVSDAANLFVPEPKQLGQCDQYRSLYLMQMGIKDYILPQWISIMVIMFVLSRFLTYFVIKTVIKLRLQ